MKPRHAMVGLALLTGLFSVQKTYDYSHIDPNSSREEANSEGIRDRDQAITTGILSIVSLYLSYRFYKRKEEDHW